MDKIATFADRLNELIETKRISKSQLAKTCGIDKSNITRYCSGAYEAKQDVIYKIANAYNVEVSWLMGYPVPMHGDSTYALAKETVQLNELIDAFDSLPPELRTYALNQIKELARLSKSQDGSAESQ